MGSTGEKTTANIFCIIAAAACVTSLFLFAPGGQRRAAAAVDPPGSVLVQQAVAAFHEARYLDALGHYRAAQQEAERLGASSEWEGRLLRGIGACLLRLSDYGGALGQFLQARARAAAAGDRENLAAIDSNICALYVYQGDMENAARICRRALPQLEGNPRSPLRAAILANLAVVELRQGQHRQALVRLEAALRAARESGERNFEAWVEDLRGVAFLGLRQFAGASEAFERGLEVRRGLGASASLTRSYMFLGRVELERGQVRAAMDLFDQAVIGARQRDNRLDLWQAHYLRAKGHRALGGLTAAAADLRRSVEALESIRAGLVPTDALQVQFEVTHQEAYAALADVLCELAVSEGGAAPEAFHAVEMGRAQSLRTLVGRRPEASRQASDPGLWTRYADRLGRLEVLRTHAAAGQPGAAQRLVGQEAELRDFEARLRLEDPVASSGVFAPATQLQEAQRDLRSDELLLNFHSGGAGTYLWAITAAEARFYRLAPPPQWRGEIRRLLESLETGNTDWSLPARRVYQKLLGGVDPALLGKRHWIIAADGEIASIPFAALPAPGGSRARRLVEEHSFSYTPSVSIRQILDRLGERRYERDFLAVADPVVNRSDPRWNGRPAGAAGAERFPRLVASQAEVRACARLFDAGRSTLLTGFDVTEGQLRRLAQQSYRYWHFSSHVVVDTKRANHSFVALSMPRQGPGLEKLTVLDIATLPAQAEMVMLSGCASGAGTSLPGAGIMGLARAFLAAGAQSVCATRWRIPDESGALAEALYRRLLPGGVDRAEALRQAQMEMIQAGDWRSEPRYWAAFFLVGSHRGGSR